MSQRFVDTPFSDFNGRNVAEARVQQNDAQNLLVEKLHVGAGSGAISAWIASEASGIFLKR
jgi:hypothetical protein